MRYVFLSLVIFVFLTACEKEPEYNSPHYKDGKFHNQYVEPRKYNFLKLMYWLTSRQFLKADWPEGLKPDKKRDLPKIEGDRMCITFINHATCLIRTKEMSILTDPQYNGYASPVSWVGPQRVIEPGIAYKDLPKIDVVLLSHDHYDSMDEKTLKDLQRDHNPLFIAGLGTEAFLKKIGLKNIVTLDWWKDHKVRKAKFMFAPAQHFSGRGLFDRFETLWGSFVISLKRKKIFFAGDTGYSSHFNDYHMRTGDMDFSMIPIGSYEPRWFMKAMHVNPEEAVMAHKDLHSKKSIGIHFMTFQMSDEAYDAPVKDLEKAKQKHKLKSQEFGAPRFGESFWVD